jgi:hypothetical protein
MKMSIGPNRMRSAKEPVIIAYKQAAALAQFDGTAGIAGREGVLSVGFYFLLVELVEDTYIVP